MTEKNAAFSGGGVSSVVGLGGYSLMAKETEFQSFSGASIGSIIAACLAAGKTPEEIREFLEDNVEEFCVPILGRKRIQKKVDKFLGELFFRDLPKECFVSITPLRSNIPTIITRDNCENLTVGEVVAMSAALPGLFLPGILKLKGRYSFVVDGGLTVNPPLNEKSLNVIFSFKRAQNFGSKKKKLQEKKAHILFKPFTRTKTRGTRQEINVAFLEGQEAMKDFLCDFKFVGKKGKLLC